MPVDLETKKTLGYCFIEYNTPQVYTLFLQCNLKIIVVLYCLLLVILMSIVFLVDVELYVVFLIWVWLNWAFIFSQEAELAKEKTHGYKLDRAHIFAVSMFDDFDRFMKVPNEWAPPETKPYAPGVRFICLHMLIFLLFASYSIEVVMLIL